MTEDASGDDSGSGTPAADAADNEARKQRALEAAKEALHRTLAGEADAESGQAEDREWARNASWLREQRPPHWG